ncbi:Gfo/Idh/MocA family protein, partial [Chloroflexota bacterium]
FVDKSLAGGGSVMDHTVHLADLMRWFFGCEVTEVYAQTNAILYSEQNTDVETGGLVMLTFANGTFASIDCSWSRPLYYPVWGNVKMEIVGANGLAKLDAFKQALTVYSHSVGRPTHAYWGSDADQGMVDEFVAAIQENRAPAITGYDGYKAVEIALAAYQSAASGEPVKLPL